MLSKILIVEDDILIAQDIANILEDNGYIVVGIASDSVEALHFLNSTEIDMMLLDINLNTEHEGIELSKQLKIPFIFLTSNTDKRTLSKAILNSPEAYLTKPFNPRDLINTIELSLFKLNSNSNTKHSEHLFIKTENKYTKVPLSDVVHIEADGSYSNIFMLDGNKYVSSVNSAQIFEKLNPHFIRIHRSHVINLNYLTSFDNNYAYLSNVTLPIGQSYIKAFKNKIERI